MEVTAVAPQPPGLFARMGTVDPTDGALRQAIRKGCVVLNTVMSRLKRTAQQRGTVTDEVLERQLTRAATLVENLRRLHAQVVPPPGDREPAPSALPTVSATMTARDPVRVEGAERLLRGATA